MMICFFFENKGFRSEYMKNSIIGIMFMCVTKLKELQENIKNIKNIMKMMLF